jgi:hypothetical protein
MIHDRRANNYHAGLACIQRLAIVPLPSREGVRDQVAEGKIRQRFSPQAKKEKRRFRFSDPPLGASLRD